MSCALAGGLTQLKEENSSILEICVFIYILISFSYGGRMEVKYSNSGSLLVVVDFDRGSEPLSKVIVWRSEDLQARIFLFL